MTKEMSNQFNGYMSPNYTPVPDELFDEQLPDLSGAELKVLLYVIRRTFGFKRESDNISISQMLSGLRTHDGRQLDRGVGLTKKTLLLAIKSLEEKNVILTERRRSVARGDEPTTYRLNMKIGETQEKSTPPVGEKLLQGGGGEITPGPWGRNYPTQETGGETEGETDINLSNIRRNINPSQLFGDSEDNVVSQAPNAPQKPLPTIVGEKDNGEAMHGEGVESVGPVLKRGRGRPPKQPHTEERQQIHAYIKDFAPQLGDQAPLASSVTRAYNLYRKSGWPIARFIDALYQARAKTRERSAGIRTQLPKDDPWGTKPKMAYFFSVLEDEVGLRDEEPAVATIR